jgi:hypothetical protein
MSEPVGNSPRKKPDTQSGMSAITGNSHKNREETEEIREPVEKMIEGKVIARKQPVWRRFTRSMLAEDAGNVGEYILTDVVIPATKNLIVDMVGQSIERVLFGTSRGRIRRSPLGMSLRDQVNYSGRYSGDRDRDRESTRRPMSREARARHDFNEIVLENRTEAVEVLEAMIARISRYGAVTVADLYDFVGTTGSFADQRWGWNDLATADVRQVPGGFLLDLPAPEPIR